MNTPFSQKNQKITCFLTREKPRILLIPHFTQDIGPGNFPGLMFPQTHTYLASPSPLRPRPSSATAPLGPPWAKKNGRTSNNRVFGSVWKGYEWWRFSCTVMHSPIYLYYVAVPCTACGRVRCCTGEKWKRPWSPPIIMSWHILVLWRNIKRWTLHYSACNWNRGAVSKDTWKSSAASMLTRGISIKIDWGLMWGVICAELDAVSTMYPRPIRANKKGCAHTLRNLQLWILLWICSISESKSTTINFYSGFVVDFDFPIVVRGNPQQICNVSATETAAADLRSALQVNFPADFFCSVWIRLLKISFTLWLP